MTVGELVTKLGFKVDEAQLASANRKMQALKGSMKTLALGIGGALVAGTAAAMKGVEAWAQQEEAVTNLAGAFASMGQNADVAVKKFSEFASARQKITTFGDEVTIQAGAALESLTGLSEEGLERAMVAAQDLASRMKIDLNTAVMMIGKTIGGKTDMLSRFIGPSGLDGITDKGKRAEIVLGRLNAQFGGAAEALGGTARGKIEIFKNAIGDVFEVIGERTLPILFKVQEILVRLAEGPLLTMVIQLSTVLEPVLITILSLIESLLPAVMPLTGLVMQLAKWVAELVQPIIMVVKDLLTPLIQILMPILMSLLDSLMEPIIEIVKLTAEILVMLAPLLVFIIQIAGWIIAGVVKGLSLGLVILLKYLRFVIGFYTQVFSFISAIGKAIMKFIWEPIENILSAIGDAIKPIFDYIGGMFDSMMKWILTKIYDVVQLLNRLPGVNINMADPEKSLEDASQKFTQQQIANSKKVMNSVKQEFNMSFGGGKEGGAGALKEAARAVFSIELKKLLVAAS